MLHSPFLLQLIADILLIVDILVDAAKYLKYIVGAVYTQVLLDVHRFKHISSSLANPTPSLPLEIYEDIVDLLEDCPESLRSISATSKIFIPRARRLLFRNIHVLSFKSMIDLAPLLLSRHCTIPKSARNFEVRFGTPFPGQKLGYRIDEIVSAFADAANHFTDFDSITLNIPWLYSRTLDWLYLQQYSNIRKFVITGTYPWIVDITQFLYHMQVLEVLVVNAEFRSDSTPTANPVLRCTKISPTLKEIALSSSSLCLMGWICELETGPKDLHVVRLKVDEVHCHNQHFYDLGKFLKKYGKKVAHLYVWFEEVTVEEELYEVLRDSLYFGPSVRQLDLLLPAIWEADDMMRVINTICRPYVRPGARIHAVAGENIGVDEREFWSVPMLCESGEAEHSALCGQLRKL